MRAMPLPFDHAAAAASYRDATEDRALLLELPDRLIACVADGAGGMVGGGTSANVVAKMVQEQAPSLLDAAACARLLLEADRRCVNVGESTAVIIIVSDQRVTGASCGDSEAWLIGIDRTVDDLTTGQHTKRRVGSGRATPVTFERAWAQGSTLIAGSDGLIRYAAPERIVAAVLGSTSAQHAADALVRLVRTASGDLLDDVAVVVARPLAL
jgi:PPM family protein phosphatase